MSGLIRYHANWNFKCCCCCLSVSQVRLSDPMDYRLPDSSVHGILQARILKWVAISFFRGSSRPRDWTQVSCVAGGFFTIWATGKLSICKTAQRIWLSPGGGTKGPWLCLVAKLLLFCLIWLFSLFLHFLVSLIKFILWLKFLYR